jgi:hypothetical protein
MASAAATGRSRAFRVNPVLDQHLEPESSAVYVGQDRRSDLGRITRYLQPISTSGTLEQA